MYVRILAGVSRGKGVKRQCGRQRRHFLAISLAILRKLWTKGQHCLQSADKEQEESRAVAGKSHDVVLTCNVRIKIYSGIAWFSVLTRHLVSFRIGRRKTVGVKRTYAYRCHQSYLKT